jgi:hypothetical protein
MALVLDFNIEQEQDGSSYTITDLTGAYDAVNNPGGWGTPNVELSDVAEAEVDLQIMDEDGNFTSVLTAGEKDVLDLPNFPNDTDGDITRTVVLEDGYYRAIYRITDNSETTYTETKYFTFYSSFKCCFSKISLAVGSCCDNQAKKLKLLEAHTILSALETAAAEQSPTTGGGLEVYKTIEYATQFCSQCGCSC